MHPRLLQQLQSLGLADTQTVPSLAAWQDLLAGISRHYGEVEAAAALSEGVLSAPEAQRLQESVERYALATLGANDGLWDWDLRTNHVYFSERWQEMLGYHPGEVDETIEAWLGRVHLHDSVQLRGEIDAHLASTDTHFVAEYRMRHQDDHYLWMLSRALLVRDVDGRPIRLVGWQTDITIRKSYEERLLHDALYDPLTGLPIRALFMDRLEQAVQRLRHDHSCCFAVFVIDIDRLKTINDAYGHTTGDNLLIAAARRMETCLQPGDTLARLNGDQYALFLERIGSADEAMSFAESLRSEVGQPFRIDGHEMAITLSIGISVATPQSESAKGLLRDADVAMYRAKAQGRSRHDLYDDVLDAFALKQMQLRRDLHLATERGELVLYYQPIINLTTGVVTGFEALVRWMHPQHGMITPDFFIPLSEEDGLIVAIGEHVLHQASEQLLAWQAALPQAADISVSINLSARQLRDVQNVSRLLSELSSRKLGPGRLKIEVTESVFMVNPDQVARALGLMKHLGIDLCIDDFGTGYSSLGYLHRFPVDILKIDRSFVSQMIEPDGSLRLVRGIIALAHDMDLRVVAEGIESVEELAALQALGCDEGQGYLFSRPVPPAEAEAIIRQGTYAVTGLKALPTDDLPRAGHLK